MHLAGIVIEYTAVFVHFGREEPGTAGLFLIKGAAASAAPFLLLRFPLRYFAEIIL